MREFSVQTQINAPIERCFDLSRSIDLHLDSMAASGERAIAGRTSGLIELGESVTWRARHFGIWQNFTSKITAMESPQRFVDEMQKGAFKSFWHEHRFEANEQGTLMTDTIRYDVPFGPLGWFFDKLILNIYLNSLITERNTVIKTAAENGRKCRILIQPHQCPNLHGQSPLAHNCHRFREPATRTLSISILEN